MGSEIRLRVEADDHFEALESFNMLSSCEGDTKVKPQSENGSELLLCPSRMQPQEDHLTKTGLIADINSGAILIAGGDFLLANSLEGLQRNFSIPNSVIRYLAVSATISMLSSLICRSLYPKKAAALFGYVSFVFTTFTTALLCYYIPFTSGV